MTAYGYIRVSTDPQSKKHGPSVQRAAIEHYCSIKSLHLVQIFEDAITGKSEQRLAFDQMLSLSPLGYAKHVVTYKTSRIGREIRVSHNMAHEITRAGYTLHTTDQGKFDFKDVGDRTMFAVSTLADQIEYDNMVQRLYESRYSAATKGKLPTRFNGYGWTNYYHPNGQKELKVNEVQKTWLHEMYKLCIEGLTTKEIAAQLNSLRVESSPGVIKWTGGQVAKLLRRKANTGLAEFSFNKTGQSIFVEVPPLVDPELFDTAQKALASRQTGGRPGFIENLDKNPLLSLVKCGHCNRRMRIHNYARKTLTWQCNAPGCHHRKSHKHKYLVEIAHKLVLDLSERPQMLSGYQLGSTTLQQQLEKQIERLQDRETNLIDLAEYGSISKEQLKERLDKLYQERISLNRQLSEEQTKQKAQSFNYHAWAENLKNILSNTSDIREIMQAAKLELLVFDDMQVQANLMV